MANEVMGDLSPWQLINECYISLRDETSSLIHLEKCRLEGVVEPKGYFSTKSKIMIKVKGILIYLEGLIEPETDFGQTMLSLYDWYKDNLKIILDKDTKLSDFQNAEINLTKQTSDFLDIWLGAKNA